MSDDRRAFLKTLARGAAYAAPMIMSFAAPVELLGQGQASEHKKGGHGHGGGGGHGHGHLVAPSEPAAPRQDPPWKEPPPGRTPPP